MTLAEIMAINMQRLMATTELDTIDKVARRSGIGRGTVDRCRKAEVSAKLDTVEALANGFGISTSYLLTDHSQASVTEEAITVCQREWLALLRHLVSEDIAEFSAEIRTRQQRNSVLVAELVKRSVSR